MGGVYKTREGHIVTAVEYMGNNPDARRVKWLAVPHNAPNMHGMQPGSVHNFSRGGKYSTYNEYEIDIVQEVEDA